MKYSNQVLEYKQPQDKKKLEVAQHIDNLRKIIDKGGPNPSDYECLTETCDELMKQGFSLTEETDLYDEIKPLLKKDSMIGFSYLKPYGYTGDFEIIDRMYQNWKSPTSTKLHKWDDFFHDLHCVQAVRNRKGYLVNELSKQLKKKDSPRVLDLASGPCTDLYEFFIKHPRNKAVIDCLDMDSNAIEYGSAVCDNYIDSITFINKNAFRFKTDKRYDLIWSAGLFDYFNDKLFIRLLNRMYSYLIEGGTLVVGNFATHNPSKGVMEVLGQWYMHHRSEEDLIDLALKAGVPRSKIKVNSEETKVNLFLHLSN